MTKSVKIGFTLSLISLLFVLGLVGCGAYVRMGTTVLAESLSPDGKWEAIVMTRNGGAMSGFSTQISVVTRPNFVARQVALCRPGNIFIADDNAGAVSSGPQGQMDVQTTWTSNGQLAISYPRRAFVYKNLHNFNTLAISYISSN